MSKKKKIIIISAVVLVVIIIIAKLTSGGDKVEYVTANVEFGTVMQTVDATGGVSSAEDIKLNFKTSGRISRIHTAKGSTVKKGQTLATLDAGALNSQVLEAQADLEKIQAGSTPEDIRISEITVEQKEQALESQKNDLENLKLQKITELKNLKDTLIVTIENELVDVTKALSTVDDTLNDADAKDTLGALDSSAVPIANQSQATAEASADNSSTAASLITSDYTNAQILEVADEVMETLTQVQECLSHTHYALDRTITSSKLTQTELNTLITNTETEQTTIQASKTAIQTSETNWTNKIAYFDDQITKAADAVAAAEDTLQLARAQLALKKADPENYEITAARARLARAQANLSDAIITSPVSGVITEINYKVGEQTSLATPAIEMIGNSELEIEVDIPESDIAKIAVGQETEITLDSFGDDMIFYGSVTFIDPAETIISDVVYYQVKVQFADGKDNVKPGMTANVTIKTTEKSNVLKVPIRAVKQRNGDRIVEILNIDQVEERKVTTGLRGDDFYEILTGLSDGDTIITFVKNGK
jgi:HlyD family secretion protein